MASVSTTRYVLQTERFTACQQLVMYTIKGTSISNMFVFKLFDLFTI